LAAALVSVVLVATLTWIRFGSYDHLMLTLDRASALGPCHGPDGARPLCDFANHYYPQGQALASRAEAVPGFYYSAFFAVFMRLLAFMPYLLARGIWAAVVVAATFAVLSAPLFLAVRRRPLGWAIYGLAFACSLPLWHDIAFGQVSSLITALVLFSFISYRQKRSRLSAVLLAIAAAIKVYPALFGVYFLVRRDRRATLAFIATVFACTIAIPLLVLGESGFVTFYSSLWTSTQRFSVGVAASPFSSFVANAIDHLWTGRVSPETWLYQAALLLGLGIATLHVLLVWRLDRTGGQHAVESSLMLGLATLPFVVRSCWVHYFVFIPLLGFCLVDGSADEANPKTLVRTLSLTATLLAVVLLSVPFFLITDDRHFYENAMPFWAVVLMLPALYRQTLIGMRHCA
jgi:alpha-1,2-mannosyltransferase